MARILTSILSFFLLCTLSCVSIAPTPMLMGQLRGLDAEVLVLYTECSTGVNYTPREENCDPILLETKVVELLELSNEFIRADRKQPQGYDFHLATSMIYFRISERNAVEHQAVELLARQFFKFQEEIGGRSIDKARFYWPYFAAKNSSFQYWNNRGVLDKVRKKDYLLPALAEGTDLIDRVQGVRLVRLRQSLQILEFIIKYIGDEGVLRSSCVKISGSDRRRLVCVRV